MTAGLLRSLGMFVSLSIVIGGCGAADAGPGTDSTADSSASDAIGAPDGRMDVTIGDAAALDLVDQRVGDSPVAVADAPVLLDGPASDGAPDLVPDVNAPDVAPDSKAPADAAPLPSDGIMADAKKPSCGAGSVLIGQYATWCGKVNVHTTETAWVVDSDCVSGCGNNTVAYCQKFWPTATHQIEIPPDSRPKPFATANCTATHSSVGQNQYMCCAPVAP